MVEVTHFNLHQNYKNNFYPRFLRSAFTRASECFRNFNGQTYSKLTDLSTKVTVTQEKEDHILFTDGNIIDASMTRDKLERLTSQKIIVTCCERRHATGNQGPHLWSVNDRVSSLSTAIDARNQFYPKDYVTVESRLFRASIG